MNEKKSLSFEMAFQRLEEILEKMNEGNISLEKSMQLFEEGDHLIKFCDKQLNAAEQKIESLIKNRDGTLACENEKPKTEPFSSSEKDLF